LAIYRFYWLNDTGQIACPAKDITCDSDDLAVAHVPDLIGSSAEMKLWTGERRVARINPQLGHMAGTGPPLPFNSNLPSLPAAIRRNAEKRWR
jgi:hypothetical protein